MDLPNTRLWRDTSRPMASSPRTALLSHLKKITGARSKSALTENAPYKACSAFTRVAACKLALSPMRDTLIEGFSHFCFLHDCSDCFRLERLPGGACTHGKAPPCHGAHPEQTSPRPNSRHHLGRYRPIKIRHSAAADTVAVDYMNALDLKWPIGGQAITAV